MVDFDSKPQSDIHQATDADPMESEWVRYLASIVMTAAATAVAVGVDSQVSIPNLSLVFVIPVIIAGLGLGLGPSLCSAVLGSLAYNFFLTEPRYSLTVDDPANIWAIGLLFVVGVITSGVAFTSARRASEAALLKKQMTILQGYSRDAMAADNLDGILSVTSQTLEALFRVPAVAMFVNQDKVISMKRVGDVEPQQSELKTALSSLETESVVRSGVYPDLTSRFDFWPVKTAEGQSAIIGLAFNPDERPSTPDVPVKIAASILSLVLDRQHKDKTGLN